jgi:hypothetical protein
MGQSPARKPDIPLETGTRRQQGMQYCRNSCSTVGVPVWYMQCTPDTCKRRLCWFTVKKRSWHGRYRHKNTVLPSHNCCSHPRLIYNTLAQACQCKPCTPHHIRHSHPRESQHGVVQTQGRRGSGRRPALHETMQVLAWNRGDERGIPQVNRTRVTHVRAVQPDNTQQLHAASHTVLGHGRMILVHIPTCCAGMRCACGVQSTAKARKGVDGCKQVLRRHIRCLPG